MTESSMTEIGTASIYKRDREDLRQWTDMDLVREAWLLDRRIARREGEQIVDEYESGAEWVGRRLSPRP
jgi:hypothetical protein